jgi:acyl-CoA dehydrogenase
MFEAYESPWMDEELNIMRDAVRKFLAKEFVPHADRWEKQGIVDRDAWTIAGAELHGEGGLERSVG